MSDEVSVEEVCQIIKNLEIKEEELTKEEEKSNVQENMKELHLNDVEIQDNDTGNAEIKQQIKENPHNQKGNDNLEREGTKEQEEIPDKKPMKEKNCSGEVSELNDDVEEIEQSRDIGDEKNEMHFNEAEDELAKDKNANKLNGMEELEAVKVSNKETLQENADYDGKEKVMCDKMCQVDDSVTHYWEESLEEEMLKEIRELQEMLALQEKLALQDFNNAVFWADAAKCGGYLRHGILNDLQSILTCLGPSLSDEEHHLAEELLELQRRGDQLAMELEAQYQAHLRQRIQLEQMIQQELHLRNALEEILAFLDFIENEAIGEGDGGEGNDADDGDDDVFYDQPRKNCRNGS